MSEYRAGYDVVECLWIDEGADFGTTPTTGTWKPIWLVNNFHPKPRPIFKEKVGVGRQLPSDFIEVKKYAEARIELELLAKQADPAFEWTDIWHYIITNAAYGEAFSLGKRLKSLSIGAKLDLATDEFWLLKGCKPTGFSIAGELDSPLKGSIDILSQVASFGTIDYVSGDATRQANPASDYIKHEDSDVIIDVGGNGASSIIDRLNSWEFSVRRTLERKGKAATDPKLYKTFVEKDVVLELRVNLDFDSIAQLTQFLNTTPFDAVIKIPSAADGRQITLSNGKWLELDIPHRELDLIALDLTAKFAGLSVATIG